METIGDLIEHNARYFGPLEAFLYEGRRLTHAQFADRSRRLAAQLYAAGMRRGDRIAILAMNCQETWDIFGAAEIAGFVAVPVNFRLAAAEVDYMLRDIQPKVVAVEPDLAGLAEGFRAAHPGLTWLELAGGSKIEWAKPFEAFVAAGDPAGPPIRSRPEDIVYLYYTSGTTGRPKGAMVTQRAALAGAELTATETEIIKGGSWLVHSPQFHNGANGPRLAQQLRGGRTVLHRSFTPERALKDIQDEKINGTMTVGTMLQAVLDVAGNYDLSSMQAWMVAGAPASPELMRRAIAQLGKIFVIQYGMTEGRVAGMYRYEVDPDAGPKAATRLRSVGRPSPHVTVRICDDDGNDCPTGVSGEVVFRSPNLFSGYWNNSAATIEALRDGWMHSGDVGYFDEDNFLYLVDRKKDMIISGGENIYSREVEDALHKHPDVIEAAVIGIPDEKWGEAVKAYVILAAGVSATEEAMIEHSRSLIARYKCPKYVEFVTVLPRVANGKIDKKVLRAQVAG
ncbi:MULTISPECIES: class I adenylate-forming enzyme family protein [unclassified Sphingobium]|uniref:class I adenylate-forming enzyme family protein n=1 Tax=unclassified Sphingobium TaxID=2611147 RepID=UPI000D155D89|nr:MULTISPECIES: AMP-binding protein [unclassified Sphingobium]MBG6120140.1 acyl-CoA synthetase (AMP-forming)/AMP-acid ligase II [Sphingobium sp. JAI105]PSO12823.1 AMP-dependent synthetase [Sphingobium sp. AEW4]TWD05659.1 acyl-CoA synthetase (AMP-forming)/AMP-acid ligase II [Sphingobium sp. AEW010]TWD23212.1 acyl-CoA synthetase (AMP-forming)/AMP-acid ligase II [Sphingobium sp. AEW013]TWD25072.1 acyl-CoA synthetase (AMP-forming)/AMP-acid ligase II [Sphingobium sp. AEW001]